jgi:diaminopimelate decarboxylase
MDIVSGGELFQTVSAGVPADKIVYAGVGKTVGEIEFSIDSGIGFFNIESEPEFVRIEEIATRKNKVMNALLRVNPDEYDAKTNEKTITGKKGGKFGIDMQYVINFFEKHGKSEFLKLSGIHIHIGSPIYSAEPYIKALEKIKKLVADLKSKGFAIRYLDIGGGYAADYENGASPSWENYAQALKPLLKQFVAGGIKIIMEPGRTIAANAGILVAEVQYIKKTDADKDIIITDTGMHHLIRPALYNANHFIWPVNPGEAFSITERMFDINAEGLKKYDIVGPICESSDYLAKDRKLPPMAQGDRLAIFTAGAYGMVMSSQYNSQPRPAEYLVDGNNIMMIRQPENYKDLICKQCEINLI